jgi:hypothetical protein
MGRHDQEQFFYSFRLHEAVPDDHPVREIAAVLDLSWVHSELAPFYPRLGRPSIDPVLMIEREATWSIEHEIEFARPAEDFWEGTRDHDVSQRPEPSECHPVLAS